MLAPYPWQQEIWNLFKYRLDSDKVPHAILLSGPAGMGKQHFARYLAASLLCHSDDKDNHQPCQQCKSCNLLKAGNHPDLDYLFPEEEGKLIKVEQIRELITTINLKSQLERYKVAIIDPADNMNRNAANTLLKTLEEPAAQSVLILISQVKSRLPVTIRSRCQTINFKPVQFEQIKSWLKEQPLEDLSLAQNALAMAKGAPLECLRILSENEINRCRELVSELETIVKQKSDPVRTAERWNSEGADNIFRWLLYIFHELACMKAVNDRPGTGIVPPEILKRLTNHMDLYRLVQCYDKLSGNNALINSQISYNAQGLLEDFIIYWQSRFTN